MTVCCARLSAPSSAAVTNRYRISLTHNFPLHSKIFYTLNSLTRSKCSQAVVKSETTRNRNFAISPNSSVAVPSDDFVVVNFYRFVFIENPHDEVAKHLSFLKDLDIHGRIYLSEQGINAQLEGGISHLPLLNPSVRATPLTPFEWRKRLEAAHEIDVMSNSTIGSNYVLLDVRNVTGGVCYASWRSCCKACGKAGYEWDVGHFIGARRPDTDCFRSTSCGLTNREVIASDPLANADKNTTNIFMYCTGGIRCDVYSTILRQQGFQNLYTLMGGVSHYLNVEGPRGWIGNLFVFDDRLSLPPSAYNPDADSSATEIVTKAQGGSGNYSFANCYVCGSHVHELRHRNCANLDCNLLFLCCINCVKDLRGCCCLKCKTSTRLRPVLAGNQRYKKWHTYREVEMQSKLTE
ncbi:rhodanese-like domain-containing protein 8, chloroplastic isoform X3 [Manihot esculenta]|uniref:rhodanese-like domain-containing protein 8, chloroplastic isoform X3 n=1 Tax=Manihot esculenta TaxID=3983 RepID=UPI000B5D588A|nr:rhodanese-like domain-containing protein 8, chloroplastic isoform X3 [Manihot esculenta]